MKSHYISLKSLSKPACEMMEVKGVDAMAAFWKGQEIAKSWGIANGSTSVQWWVEDFSGRQIGRGEWVRPSANAVSFR